jgi:hypothetical protein
MSSSCPKCVPGALLLLVCAASSLLGPAPASAQSAGAGRPAPGTRQLTPEEIRSQAVPGTPIVAQPSAFVEADHAAAGIGLRNRGGGVINLRGVPDGATAVRAFLYWDVLMADAPPTMTVSFNAVGVSGNLIGQGESPCWGGGLHNFAYRAEVPLPLLFAGINGDYGVAGVPSGIGTGSNPWESAVVPPLAEGATLAVFFRAPGGRFQQTYVYETPISGSMFTVAIDIVLTGFRAPRSDAKLTLVGADGQRGGGLTGNLGTLETSFLDGHQFAGPTSPFLPTVHNDSDWNGQDGQPLNQLWDTRTHVVTTDPGASQAALRYVAGGDCLVPVALLLSL